jgi:predicted MFS family arabinose efflux permease
MSTLPTSSAEPTGARKGQLGAARPRRFALWRNRDYMLLWGGQTVSSVGTGVSRLAFPLLVLDLTRSALQAGLIGALEALPYVILSLPAGALIDRWDRKRVMLLCDTGRATAMGSIPVALVLGRLTVAQLYLVALVEGTLFVFFNLAEVACLPRVVLPAELPAATAQNMATDGIAGLLSPQIGGALYGLRQLLPFAADAISYAFSVASLFLIRTRFQGERVPGVKRSLRAEISEGLAWLWRQPLIRYIAFLTGGWNFVTAGEALFVIILARQQHASDFTIGTLFAIGGAGGILGAILATPIQRRFRFGPVIIATVWISALAMPFFLLAPSPLWLGVVEAVAFITGPIYNVVQFSYRLSLIPDELQGRVNSVFRLLAFGLQPLGLALTGVLIQSIHVAPTVLVFAACMIALAVTTTLNRRVRQATARA